MEITRRKIVRAMVVGALVGIAAEFIFKPVIAKPIEDKIDEVLEK